jgi:hypothetical protein
MRPVRKYGVKGGPPRRSPGAYSRWGKWNLVPLCRYRPAAAPQTGEVTTAVRGSVGGDVYLRHPIAIPALWALMWALRRGIAHPGADSHGKAPIIRRGFLCLIQAVTDSGGLAQKPCQPLCRPLPYHLATAPKDSKPNVRQQVPQSGRRHCPVWTYARSGCSGDHFESRDGIGSESRAA